MLREQVAAIQSREDLGRFIRLLAQDLADHPDEWENSNLGYYLEALSACIDDMDGYFRYAYGTDAPKEPTWRLIGETLLSAKMYE